ncbi:Ion transport protein-domain-containing protein [Dunaliella salina]|uniref:Ion transport protein-domain-containing protein n=1 Tax=Dunaliella salina TaxID=3046 RepID=A0ABQ7GAC4_DUNSA|nr:Ion transport protein-domain-containing protein [Dunaliella salina]|eukprot:KAF5831559.1 Ion transport protein-domain-containing protein [Dunaliella salina]
MATIQTGHLDCSVLVTSRILRVLSHAFSEGIYLLALVLLFMFVMGLLGMQFFGYQIAWCGKMEGASQRCPPGVECPLHRECYVDCRPEQLGQWFEVDRSPYNGLAYCERFPRDFDPSNPGDNPQWPLYWAQVGKPHIGSQHFDNMLHSFITVFIIMTLDNWTDIMYPMMSLINPWVALYFVVLIILGSFMLLQLFLAILLGSLDKVPDAVFCFIWFIHWLKNIAMTQESLLCASPYWLLEMTAQSCTGTAMCSVGTKPRIL